MKRLSGRFKERNHQETLELLKTMLVDEGFKYKKNEFGVFYFESIKIFAWEGMVIVSNIPHNRDIDYSIEAIQQGHIQPIVDWLAVWGVRPE